jgi:hypothetical protein
MKPAQAKAERRARASRSHNRVIEATAREAKTGCDVIRFQIRQLVEHLLT